MGPLIIDGQKAANSILDSLKNEILELKTKTAKIPGLAVILVGDNLASHSYVKMKKRDCLTVGIQSFEYRFDKEIGQKKITDLIHELNKRDDINGILLQLPLPKGYEEDKLLDIIDPQKDIDGFHPMNVGRLLLGLETIVSCTPLGIYELLKFYNISPKGKHVVIVGRSNIVGKPLAALLIQREDYSNATVTICHSHTQNLKDITSRADILVAAMGSPEFVTQDMVKEDVIIIDVGINRVADNSDRGYHLVGDVDYQEVLKKASAITPVPGGVGPMTRAMLMKNTVRAFTNQQI